MTIGSAQNASNTFSGVLAFYTIQHFLLRPVSFTFLFVGGMYHHPTTQRATAIMTIIIAFFAFAIPPFQRRASAAAAI